MKTALKRVASLLLALIMILEVVAPGVVEARSAGQNRATVSDEEFIPPDGNRIDPDQNAGSHLPNFIDPDDDGYYTPPQKTPARPAQNAPAQASPKQGNEVGAAADVEVSEEKAPKPLIEDEAKSKEMALEFSEEKERVRVASPMNPGGLEDKKFTILTRFDTSTVNGPVKAGQTFTLHLDDKLMVKDPSTLKRLSHNGTVITEAPVYDKTANTITYKIRQDITQKIQVPMAVDVDYNTANIDPNAKKFTIINKVTGIGVTDPKDLLPVVVDSNGNMLSSIIEPGRDDVVEVIEEGDNYKVNVDAYGEPVVNNKEMAGIRWTVRITSDRNLKDLGLKTNFTTVKGSGLGEIQNISVTNTSVPDAEFSNNPAQGNLGIVSSKHHNLNTDTKELYYTFYTPRTTKQGSYMLDLSTVLTKKYIKGTTNPVIGAVRLILPEGYNSDQIREATPTRVGMNNRTTVMGEFTSGSTAKWTVTDAVSSKDPEKDNTKLPLEDRKLEGKQTVQSAQMAVYAIDAQGKMVLESTENIGDFPQQGTKPGAKAVGTIAVYEVDANLTDPNAAEDYAVSGVAISKYQDLYVKQVWGDMPDNIPMPQQKFFAKGENDANLGEWTVNKGDPGKTSRNITLAGAKYWDIDSNGIATRLEHKIVQEFIPKEEQIGKKQYSYYENLNYYTRDDETDQKYHFIQNRAVETTEDKPGTFNVVKVDGKEPTKKLEGARFKLNGANVEATTGPDGKATFSNIPPGNYTLIETKAPEGYKLGDQSRWSVTITTGGDISVTGLGSNASFSSGGNKTKVVEHDRYPSWPDYMNAMRYGKLENGNLSFYLYLKPHKDTDKNATNRDTRLSIALPSGMTFASVAAYNVRPDRRAEIYEAMEKQTVEEKIGSLGNSVINAPNHDNKIIEGTANKKDPYTKRTGYEILFPKERFNNDWGFLVKVTANVGVDEASVPLNYDWLTNTDTANQTRLQELVTINSESDGDNTPTLTISNEEFTKQPVSVTKVDKDKNILQGATFVLKDKNGRPIDDVPTDENGVADFGKLPAGKYIIEEIKAPTGYIASSVVFDVTVSEKGEVTYTPRFKSGSGDPVQGTDYFIENEESTQKPGEVKYTITTNKMEIQENEPGDIGVKKGVWEAYRYESLKYTAEISINNTAPGSKFSIQFDPNLDFKQYVNDMPKIRVRNAAGVFVDVADPYFDYSTNRLTYVFNENSTGGLTDATIHIRGITPNKFYAQNSDRYYFKTTVLPDVADADIESGLDKKTINFGVDADYERYDTNRATPAQSYYHRDIYTGADGEEYFTVLAYYNPLRDNHRTPRTLRFNWLSTSFGGNNKQIIHWPANGNTPAFDLQNVKIYRTSPDLDTDKYGVRYNKNMPLSFGVRPEQDPNTYTKVYEKSIDPTQRIGDSANGFTLNYYPDQIQSWGTLNQNTPLKIDMPQISRNNEGYIIEQTFKVKKGEKDKWFNLFRAFYMSNGVMESAFASKVNKNTGVADQTDQEIPKFYKQKVKLVNRKYTPGNFIIEKFSSTDKNQKLQGATFALTNEKGQTIYRTTDDSGKLSFKDLPPGNYALVETKAPENFMKSDVNWQVAVSNNGIVTITEMSLGGGSVVGSGIILEVPNKPIGEKFRVYKKDAKGIPLKGAKFTITRKGEKTPLDTAESNTNGYVEFNNLTKGTYILEETEAPVGYNKLNKKWVIVVGEDNKAKVYNYTEGSGTGTGATTNTLLKGEDTHWVDVAHRPLTGWDLYDNRWQGWVGNSPEPYKMGTRIIGINKTEKYVIQRYIINPEGYNLNEAKVEIHREKPGDQNMTWYKGNEEFKVYKLTKKPVTGKVEDFRLADYNATEITQPDFTTGATEKSGEPDRKSFDFKNITGPIVIDVKVPYDDERGGVGTGMDLWIDHQVYWKSDYYERVSDIVLGEKVSAGADSDILGSYISEGSLDVTNEQKKYSFKLKKVKDDDPNTTIQGATFSLKGPGENGEERTLVTDEKGIIQFNDLVEGTYKLEETKPAQGYDKVNTTWTVTITKKGEVFMKDDSPTGKSSVWDVAKDTTSPAHQMSRSAVLNDFLAPFGEEAAPVSAEAPAAEEAADAKESAAKAEAPSAIAEQAEEAKDAANAGDAAKAENADAAEASEPISEKISTTKQLDNFLTTFGANDGLELGEENVPSPVGAGVWEKVDPARSEGIDHRHTSKTEAPMDTKILEINKVDNRFKQAFIYGEPTGGTKPREIQIHFWENAYDVTTNRPNWTKVKVYQVDNGSIDNPGNKREITSVRWTPISNNKTGNKFRLKSNIIPKTIKGWILVEVETPYMEGLRIGLGSDYRSNTDASTWDSTYTAWIAESYGSESDINCKHLITVNQGQNGRILADPSSAKANTTVTLSATPDTGYELDHYTVTNTTTQEETTFTGNTFTMPDSDVTVTATFKKKAPPKYDVQVNPSTNGSVTASPSPAAKDETVTLTIQPENGYRLKTLTVTDLSTGFGITPNAITTGTDYSFKMPASRVSVSATFEPIPAQTFNVNPVASPTEGGTVVAAPSQAAEGTEVTVSATANEGYTLAGISVTAANGATVDLNNNKFTMPASNVTVTATFTKNPDSQDLGTEIPEGNLAVVKNKQTGLDMKIFKKNFLGTGLKDAIFTLKETEADFKTEKPGGVNLKAKSEDKTGRLIFIDGEGNPLNPQPLLPQGYYVLKEETAPSGYKKITAPWNIHIKQENGQLVAEYRGPEDTASSYLTQTRVDASGKPVDKALVKELNRTPSGIKYASRVTAIDPEAKTFNQRIYLDTRERDDIINVQITPLIKREEMDYAPREVEDPVTHEKTKIADPPDTLEPGVKTAYRTTYKVADAGATPDVDSILKSYDLSKENVSMVNTARWRPFDWGFDEDQLNLKPGVYFIDVEGYYDDNIVTEGKIDIKLDFFSGERTFRQATAAEFNNDKTIRSIDYKERSDVKKTDSFLAGNLIINGAYERIFGKGNWLNEKPSGAKYINMLSRLGGKIVPSVDPKDASYETPVESQTTSIDIESLYTSKNSKVIPREGMIITDEEESYNITFSKHGRDGDGKEWSPTGNKVANNRLEGAVFKLQQWTPNSNDYEDVPGSYVASAFNGYFGFRGLKPGRYRIKEVKAPEGYKPIEDPILYFKVAYTEKELEITDPNGKSTIIPGKQGYISLEYDDKANGIYQYVKADGTEVGGKLVDFVTSGTARNMGKIVNEKPGKGEVTVTKVDDNLKALKGATFKLTRLSSEGKTDAQGKPEGVWTKEVVNEDGTVNFKDLGIGNYRLEEVSPPTGYMKTGMIWNFTVGGKDLDPYAEDTNKPTRDITKDILLETSDVKVQKYMEDDNPPTDNNIYPHKAQSVSILSDFKLKDGAASIQPGDYFTVQISDSIDLQGIYKNRSIANLDIFADGVGTIAKAKYDKDKGTITYTFTDYAKSYTLLDFKTQLVAWINLEEITKDTPNVPVGIGLDGESLKTTDLNVHYDIKKETSSHPDYNVDGYNHNISGKIYELDPETGEFVQYYYINRQKLNGYYMPRFRFSSNQELSDVSISIDKLKNNSDANIEKWMPESFAVPAYDGRELWPTARYNSRSLTSYTYDFSNSYYEGMGPDDSYIVTVRGRANPKYAKGLHNTGEIILWNYYGYPYVLSRRQDWAYFDENKTEAKAKLAIRAVNPTNRVVFKKVDIQGKPLKDAIFTLYWKNPKTGKYQVSTNVRSQADGVIPFENIAKGEYFIKETRAPEGYVKNEDVLLEFTVDDSGKIIKKVKDATGNPVGQGEEVSGIIPIPVVNHKKIQLEKRDAFDKTFLAGAEFDVYYKEKENDEYQEYKIKDPKNPDGEKITYHVKVGEDGELKGKVSLNLYKAGYYALKETKAPKDYILPPEEFVKEFRLEDDRFSVKEKGFEGKIKKEDYGTDVDTSFVLGERNSGISGAFNAYVVINPAHEERSYKPDANVLFNYQDLGYYTMQGYRIDKAGKRTDFTPDVTRQNGHDPKADLYKAAGGTNEAEFKSTDTIVLKLVATPDKADNPVTITTAITDGSGSKKAEYKFKYGDLPKAIDTGTYPKHPEAPKKPANYDSDDKAKAEYDKAVATYKAELKDYLDHYRNKDLTIQHQEAKPVEVLNYKGVYPFTGGFGPNRWIVIIGAVIAAVAAEEYIRRKRTSAPKGGA